MATQLNITLSRYISMVNTFPKLSREEESELWRRWHNELDVRAKEDFIRSNLRHAVSIALKYNRYGLPLSELIAEGNFGLVHALSKFEPERGNRFVTYAAYWIRAHILEYVIRCWSLVCVGSGPLRSKLFFKLRRERVRIQNLVGEGEQADTLLAQQFGVSRDQMVELMQRLEARDLSLDLKVSEGAVTSLVDTLPSSDCNQEQAYVNSLESRRIRDIVRAAFDELDIREKLIIENHLMRDSEDELSLADIGRRLGVSRERARQLETRAKHKLRNRILELSGNEGLGESGIGVNSAA